MHELCHANTLKLFNTITLMKYSVVIELTNYIFLCYFSVSNETIFYHVPSIGVDRHIATLIILLIITSILIMIVGCK